MNVLLIVARAGPQYGSVWGVDGIIEVSDDDLRDALGEVAAQRAAAEDMATKARDGLALASTEALMAGWTLRDVAEASGYSISGVRRAKLDAHRRRAGWYPAVTREGWLQFFDSKKWLMQFRRPAPPGSDGSGAAPERPSRDPAA